MSARSVLAAHLAAAGALLVLGAGAAEAETLSDAIRLAYQSNPALRAQRSQLRQTDEDYVQARAGLGPQVNVQAQGAYHNSRLDQTGSFFRKGGVADHHAGTGAADLSIAQPLFTSGAARAQVQGAAAEVLAGREDLRQSEAKLLNAVITAYVDVRRDRETLKVLQDGIDALTRDFEEIKAKGAAGQLTKTDVAESEARLLAAHAELDLAQGRLNASVAEYVYVVGQSPGQLEPEPDLPGMPKTVDEAFDAAERNNAQLLSALQGERAAREKVNEAKAATGPTVALKLDANVEPEEPYLAHQYDKDLSVSAVYNQPLFTSGINSSRIRQALERDKQAQLNVEYVRRGVVQQVARAWSALVSTDRALDIQQKQADVEEAAVVGNRIEQRVGTRSTFELMNAEFELTDARLRLLQSRHDAYIARAELVAAMGLLEARFLTPGAQLYDPQASLKRVERVGAVPWEGAVERIDGLVGPRTPAPHLSAPDAGAERPAGLPPLDGKPD
jgi:outer membrane protein